MTQHTAVLTNKAIGGLLVAAVATCGFAASALGPAPTANATCASFWGLGNSADCTSGFGSLAVAFGPNATAYAQGLFGAAISIGTGADAEMHGNFNLSLAAGPNAVALSYGALSTAVAVGVAGGPLYTSAQAGDSASDFLNVAVGLGKDGGANAYGTTSDHGNLAFFLGQGGLAVAEGTLSAAINVGGAGPFLDNLAHAHGVLNSAVNLGGNNNSVDAGPGPLAIAVSALKSGATVTKTGPGFNINGFKVGGAAALTQAPATATTATVKPAAFAGNKRSTAGSAAAPKHASTK